MAGLLYSQFRNLLSLHVDEGEVFGFLGPNGAGKTTTVRMLACLISKSSGNATIGD
ncbi:MAG: ATP-binding cassette domain-containing protein, partial [Thaumarchaeota archaeon]|nr:ATP-binding cassette domain-containing protein [Nitrososphaerota archaeon]